MEYIVRFEEQGVGLQWHTLNQGVVSGKLERILFRISAVPLISIFPHKREWI
jgi:hypothetical protein